jgi:hypothetical protein
MINNSVYLASLIMADAVILCITIHKFGHSPTASNNYYIYSLPISTSVDWV